MSEHRLAALAISAAALAPERLVRGGPVLCPFRRVTGRPCPACGLTRSWNAAARFKLRDSLRFHPLGIPALVALLLIGRGELGGRQVRIPSSVAGIATIAWLAVWLQRVRSGTG